MRWPMKWRIFGGCTGLTTEKTEMAKKSNFVLFGAWHMIFMSMGDLGTHKDITEPNLIVFESVSVILVLRLPNRIVSGISWSQ